ncbi:MAG: hypothetical protein RLZZ356_1333, partial [Verrucomicrobiota bacterium]|jgi:hypothetical protein
VRSAAETATTGSREMARKFMENEDAVGIASDRCRNAMGVKASRGQLFTRSTRLDFVPDSVPLVTLRYRE